jgi:mannose-6-phosphate isomerase-like protein (cupin superfamily)
MATNESLMSHIKVSVSHLNDQSFSASGRRTFVQYRDVGVTDSMQGRASASVARLPDGNHQQTGWHYHTCDIIFYILKGWLEVEFEDLGFVHLDAGAVVTIPTGRIHNELRASPDMEVFEVTFPAEVGTISVEAPAQVG